MPVGRVGGGACARPVTGCSRGPGGFAGLWENRICSFGLGVPFRPPWHMRGRGLPHVQVGESPCGDPCLSGQALVAVLRNRCAGCSPFPPPPVSIKYQHSVFKHKSWVDQCVLSDTPWGWVSARPLIPPEVCVFITLEGTGELLAFSPVC